MKKCSLKAFEIFKKRKIVWRKIKDLELLLP
jgi:hypothetical protein